MKSKTKTSRAHAKGKKAAAAKDRARKAVITEIRNRLAATEPNKPGRKGRKGKADNPSTPTRLSAMNAAVQVLAESGKPMRVREIIEEMAKRGLWSSPNGKTPHATLAASIIREIAAKGKESRFKKVDRGLFAATSTAG
ncbi:MAG: winged helix-turn-helix domain-containing protein [Phycisphaerales bacterium]|nr:winged helix-turn-helix domain-containing protein [Phycisphaerales bacterium]